MSKLNITTSADAFANAKDKRGLVALAKSQGTAEGAGTNALPNIALSIAAAAAAGHITVDNVKEITTAVYKAYGETRNASGNGKPINVVDEKAMNSPVSKLTAFAKLGLNTTKVGNRTIAEAFFADYGDDRSIWAGDHYERLYKAVSRQNAILRGDKAKKIAPAARLMSRDEIEALFASGEPEPVTEVKSLETILKGIDLHVNGAGKGADAATVIRRPAFGKSKAIEAAISALSTALKQAEDKAKAPASELIPAKELAARKARKGKSFVNPEADASA